MSDEENKILKFPEPPPEDKILWECKACKHHITESMEKAETDDSKVLPLNYRKKFINRCYKKLLLIL